MKHIIFLLVVFIQIFISVPSVKAHLEGQPPYFKMNGVYSDLYSVQQYSASPNNPVPQDISNAIYVTNEPILFEIDKTQLAQVIPSEIIEKTKFLWDFGDGTTGTGLTNSHAYTKMGTYILSIYADTSSFEKGVSPQLLQSVLFYVLPNKNYKIPSANIKVNGEGAIKDTTTNVLQNVFDVDFTKKVEFDGGASGIGSAKIVSYTWDFGDGTKEDGQKVFHMYQQPYDFLTPVLRVTDANGFYVESSVGIKKDLGNKTRMQIGENSPTGLSLQKQIGIGVFIMVLSFFFIWFVWFKKGKRRK